MRRGHERVAHPYGNACRDGRCKCSEWRGKSGGDSTILALRSELTRARTKFPGNAKLLAALMEEVGELAQAMLQDKPLAEIQKEAIQVACVAVRIFEEGDSDFGDAKQWSKLL